MQNNDIKAIFFDLGDTLGTAELAGSPPHLTVFHVFGFVPNTLQHLQDRGLRLGIISNTGDEKSAAVDAVLSAAGILKFFESNLRIYSGDVEMKKDNPAIFTLAATRAGFQQNPERCLFVGEDSRERAVALSAELRVCPHPLLIGEVLDGQSTRFVRIAPPSNSIPNDWTAAIRSKAA